MAYICPKTHTSCKECEHYRYDDDYGAMACFARQDEILNKKSEEAQIGDQRNNKD